MPVEEKTKKIVTHGVLFVSLTVATAMAILGPQFMKSDAGAWVLGIIAIVFVAALLTLTAIATAEGKGHSFSEILRDSTVDTTFYPWALAVYCGRWFHPVDSLSEPLGVFGPVLIMVSTWIVVVVGELLEKNNKQVWPWLIVLLGFIVGTLAWPA